MLVLTRLLKTSCVFIINYKSSYLFWSLESKLSIQGAFFCFGRVASLNIRTPLPWKSSSSDQRPEFFIMKRAATIQILLLKVQERPVQIFQFYRQFIPIFCARWKELASNLEVWIFLYICHYLRIFASQPAAGPWICRDFCIPLNFLFYGGGGGFGYYLQPPWIGCGLCWGLYV